MKWMIASDIHGSQYYCQQLVDQFKKNQCDRMVLLGDILYHGPRNDLPKGYDPKGVIALLNPWASSILCVRGNCDSEVDQMILDFPLVENVYIDTGKHVIYCCHGHKPFPKVPIIFYGHTHIPEHHKEDDTLFCNPGSISLPKAGSTHSYMLLENDVLTWKSLDHEGDETYHV